MRTVKVNGFVCKDPMAVNADDFFKAANLDKPKNTKDSKVGSIVTLINAMELPGLNTLGISLARIDYAPLGENPPHTHPRATEILTVLEGTLYVGLSPPTQTTPCLPRSSTRVTCSYSPKGSSTSSSTPSTTSQRSHSLGSAAKTLVLSPSPMQSLDQSRLSQMMFWPRHSRWRREQLIGFRLSSGRTTTTKSNQA